jgi:uncharacterized protein YbjT (DUF2867 family)
MTRFVVAAGSTSRTGHLVAERARRRGDPVRTLGALDDPTEVAEAVRDAGAIVLMPKRGDAERHAHTAARTLIVAAQELAPAAHLLLVTSFAVGYGPAHPLNRVTASPPYYIAVRRGLGVREPDRLYAER